MAATSAKSTLRRAAARTSSRMVFDDSSKKAWPPYEVPLAAQVALWPIFRVMPQAQADRLRHDAERERRRTAKS